MTAKGEWTAQQILDGYHSDKGRRPRGYYTEGSGSGLDHGGGARAALQEIQLARAAGRIASARLQVAEARLQQVRDRTAQRDVLPGQSADAPHERADLFIQVHGRTEIVEEARQLVRETSHLCNAFAVHLSNLCKGVVHVAHGRAFRSSVADTPEGTAAGTSHRRSRRGSESA